MENIFFFNVKALQGEVSLTGWGKDCWVCAAAAPPQETGVSWCSKLSSKLMWVTSTSLWTRWGSYSPQTSFCVNQFFDWWQLHLKINTLNLVLQRRHPPSHTHTQCCVGSLLLWKKWVSNSYFKILSVMYYGNNISHTNHASSLLFSVLPR